MPCDLDDVDQRERKKLNRRNYQKELDKIIETVCSGGVRPALFLHSCCAPCSSYVLSYLSEYFRITDFYYNPNIAPRTEYIKRSEELKRLINDMGLSDSVKFIEGRYDNDSYLEAVRGLENEPEGGSRCRICFRIRLEEAARMASEGGYDYFTTTLTISPMKDPVVLNDIGEEMGDKYKVRWLPSEFRKQGGFQRSIELSKQYDLYRQNYCGCVFSRRDVNRKLQEEGV